VTAVLSHRCQTRLYWPGFHGPEFGHRCSSDRSDGPAGEGRSAARPTECHREGLGYSPISVHRFIIVNASFPKPEGGLNDFFMVP